MRRRTLPLVLAAVVVLAASAVAFARVAATGTVYDSERGRPVTEHTLEIQNTGDEPLRCMRFVAPEGVEIFDAIGPGQTTVQRPRGFASQGFEIAPGGKARWTFSTRDPYPFEGGGQLDVSSSCEPGSDASGMVLRADGPPPRARLVTVRRESGLVRFRRRGSRRFVRVTGRRSVLPGSVLDVSDGTAVLDDGTSSAEVSGGRVVVDETTGARPLTRLRLSEPLTCPRTNRAGGSAARSRSVLVEADGAGFAVRGRYATAVADAPATWRTTDRCRSTEVRAAKGEVTVTARSGRTATARPGRRVVAVPPRRS